MRRLTRLVLLAALLAVTLPLGAAAQWQEITVNTIKPAITSTHQCIGPSSTTCVRIETDGSLNPQVANADGYVFLPANGACIGSTTNLTPTRVAANDWALARTAASVETINITCSLNSWLQRMGGSHAAGGSRGVKITALTIHHQITTQDLLRATWNKLATRRFANNTANDIGPERAGAVTLPTATQTDPYATSVPITTALFLPILTGTDLNLDFSVETKASAVYRLYGIGVTFSRI